MALTAHQARKNSAEYIHMLTVEHAKEYKAMKAAERRKINALKKSGRFDELVAKIEGHVKRISKKGGRDFTDLEYFAFYLKGEDTILFDELMQHFKKLGFQTKEYQGFGINLAW